MICPEEFNLPSSDGISTLYCVRWMPVEEVRATVQISHGMIEHIRRYHQFAVHLAKEGIVVYGHDHLGHGYTGKDQENLGFFADKEGSTCLIKDLHRVSCRAKKEFPGVPHFILGHSMGSFFVRRYITLYGEDLAGAILMGTGNQSLALVVAGKFMTGFIGRMKGMRYRSPMMHNLVLGGYNRRFEPVQTIDDWLSRDDVKVREYVADPYCNFYFTCGAYRDFFNIMLDLKMKKQFHAIPRQLPVYIMSGKEDPVGDFGKGPQAVKRQFEAMGMTDTALKLYSESRHELLNEIDREIVYEDISRWLFAHIR